VAATDETDIGLSPYRLSPLPTTDGSARQVGEWATPAMLLYSFSMITGQSLIEQLRADKESR
jgi:hypothetical protein